MNMEIKTIWDLVDHSGRFDEEVNTAIRDGWTLVKRKVLPGERYTEASWAHRLLYAELTKDDTAAAEPTKPAENFGCMQDAIRYLARACKHISDCGRCPVRVWCLTQRNPALNPLNWEVDE